MDREEILKCLCFVILGYFVAMIFSRMCSCGNGYKNGFSVDAPAKKEEECVCSGQTNQQGEGGSNCLSPDYVGPWCYTNPGVCGKRGFSGATMDWSRTACNSVQEPRCPPDSYIYDDDVDGPICKCNEDRADRSSYKSWNKTFNENHECVPISSLSDDEMSVLYEPLPCPIGEVFTKHKNGDTCE